VDLTQISDYTEAVLLLMRKVVIAPGCRFVIFLRDIDQPLLLILLSMLLQSSLLCCRFLAYRELMVYDSRSNFDI
jgi:hypothetical protein